MHVYALKGGIHALTWYCFALSRYLYYELLYRKSPIL